MNPLPFLELSFCHCYRLAFIQGLLGSFNQGCYSNLCCECDICLSDMCPIKHPLCLPLMLALRSIYANFDVARQHNMKQHKQVVVVFWLIHL